MKLVKWRSRALVAALCISAASSTAISAVYRDAEGWTVITPSQDSRIVYVSSSEGNNSNNGLSPSTPKKTIQAGAALIRDGWPDHLLLKRGDVFEYETTNTLLGSWRNGRSAQEPVVVSYYGSSGARPVIKLNGILVSHNSQKNYNAFIGLDVYKSNSDPNSPDFDNEESTYTFRMVGGGDSLIIEDCRIRFGGITIESYPENSTNKYSNVQVRRNIVTDGWKHNSSNAKLHISGIFMRGVIDSYLIEENYWDHNGWNTQIAGAGANQFAHNLYLQYSNVAGGIIRGNISVRPSAHGLQARSGGVVERNLFAYAAIGANIGGEAPPTDPDVYTFNNRMVQNVVLNGRRMVPNDGSYPQTTALYGLVGSYIGDVDVIDNIVANRIDSGTVKGIEVNTAQPPIQFFMSDNIIYNWKAGQDMYDPSWPDPDADLGDYWASTGGSNSESAFYTAHRNRGLREYPWHLTAYAAISFFREGFNKGPVSGYYDYIGEPNSTPYNVALGASVTTTSHQTGNGGENLVDGDTGDEPRWSAQFFPQSATIDLGTAHSIHELRVHPFANRDYRYTIQASLNGSSYTTIVNRSNNTQAGSLITDTISPVSARYIRITVTGAATYPWEWVSIRELEVIGTDL